MKTKTKATRTERRAAAEARTAKYQALPLAEKLARNSTKVKAKLTAKK